MRPIRKVLFLLVLLMTPGCQNQNMSQHTGGTWHFDGIAEIRAYRLNWDDPHAFGSIITPKGNLNSTRLPEVGIPLNKEQEGKLQAAVTGTHLSHPVAACFYPHHAFVFFDDSGKIIGHVDICFICSNYRGSPTGFADRWDLESLEQLVLDLGMPKANEEWDG